LRVWLAWRMENERWLLPPRLSWVKDEKLSSRRAKSFFFYLSHVHSRERRVVRIALTRRMLMLHSFTRSTWSKSNKTRANALNKQTNFRLRSEMARSQRSNTQIINLKTNTKSTLFSHSRKSWTEARESAKLIYCRARLAFPPALKIIKIYVGFVFYYKDISKVKSIRFSLKIKSWV